MTDSEDCGNCRFWQPAWKFKKKSVFDSRKTAVELPEAQPADHLRKAAERGLCRRHAPRASALTTVWMETRSMDWCGEHEIQVE